MSCQVVDGLPVSSEVGLTPHQDDRGGGGEALQFVAPDVHSTEQGPRVTDLVAEQEDVRIAVGDLSRNVLGRRA